MNSAIGRGLRRAFLPVFLLTLGGCEGDVVFREPSPFEQPPAGAGDFLGYSSVETKRTVCGNCHVGKQAAWQQTAHASAFGSLAASGAAQAVCEGCHTVNARGNVSTAESAGWLATKNDRYKDVQCESCHGPGLTHVMNPDMPGTKPLATLAVGVDLSRGCGQCHSGAHQPFAEEWSTSGHARFVAYRATNVACIGCHEAKGVLQAWGVNSTFMVETGENQHLTITCAVCHDPHDRRNPAQLRFLIDAASTEHNLCMKCHQRRSVPDVASASGPHSPEGPLLLGEAGWFPPNFEYPPGALVGSHGSDRNPRLCATCHVNGYEVRDQVTNAFTFRATGHSFQAIPCVGADGLPDGNASCELTARSFRSCTGCHLTETAARSAYAVAELRIARLTAEIAGLLARIPASEFVASDNRYTTAEGSRFNMQLAQKKGSIAHNPFLLEGLLLASIRQIETDYGIKPSMGLSLRAELETPPGVQ
ncbi:MAG TPA: cytochrome c3 family protein [Longimicrobiales bacterium]|nr:cytochrome c3 family protein [Longimicrobiales bacterium]